MQLVLVFALLLFAGVLVSCRAQQSVLSTSVLFLVAGLFLGKFAHLEIPHRSALYTVAEIALYSVLFSDGMKTGGIRILRRQWRPMIRTLAIGMPITIAILAAMAHWLAALGWRSSLALGAVLSPTDPVFVSAFLEVEAVPARVKEILTVESGFNDGLALPAVFLLLPQVMHMQSGSNGGVGSIVLELVEGLALEVAIPFAATWVEQLSIFGASGVYQRLNPFAIALIVYAMCQLLHANLFLGGFAAGMTVGTRRSALHEAFKGFAEPTTELLKLATILIFTLRVAPVVFTALPWKFYIVVLGAAFLVRLAAVPVALVHSDLSPRDSPAGKLVWPQRLCLAGIRHHAPSGQFTGTPAGRYNRCVNRGGLDSRLLFDRRAGWELVKAQTGCGPRMTQPLYAPMRRILTEWQSHAVPSKTPICFFFMTLNIGQSS
jgi:sodium/hydrogen antiporter